MSALFVLEDGSSFEGISIGSAGERVGEVMLHTAVVGYQEIMTDPANAGKIVVLTYPLIGNYGVAEKFNESPKCRIEALVIKEKSRMASNWQAEDTFDRFLKSQGVVAISEVDTRTLAVRIRDNGEMLGIVSSKGGRKADLLKRLQTYEKERTSDYIKRISVKKVTELEGNGSGPKIGVLDLGILKDFIKQLQCLGCNVTLLPYNTDDETILGLNFDGVVVSSGPEEDQASSEIVPVVQRLLGKIPLLGISAGHEIICRALGGKLKRMTVGHHGVNYPVRSPDSYKGNITVQNHSYIVDEDSIKNRDDVRVTLRNVNDNSIEEMESEPLRFVSTQYYPASPGFDEVHGAFKRFVAMTQKTG